MLSVGVFNDLFLRDGAGGHVKSWERFAEAALERKGTLDLTVHFLGETSERIELGENVRYMLHPPAFSTERLGFLSEVVDHTDLARVNRKVLRDLPPHDVLHTTHALFALGRTARLYARRASVPLVNSVQPDVPKYAEIYSRAALDRMVGSTRPGRWLVDGWNLPARRRKAMAERLDAYWRACAHVFVSHDEAFERARRIVPRERVSYLRRGIDLDRFGPDRADRIRLSEEFGIPEDRPLVLFVGRIDGSKSVMTLARALRRLLDDGVSLHALVVGEGSDTEPVRALLGEAVSTPGPLPQESLGRVYASSDVFVFPSRTETFGNVVVEAMASGLPVVVSGDGGARRLVERGVDGLVVQSDDAREWADAVAELLSDRERTARMSEAAAERVRSTWPTWGQVLDEDLLPVWERVVAGSQSR